MCRFSVNRRRIRHILHRFQNVKRFQKEFDTAMSEDLNPLLKFQGCIQVLKEWALENLLISGGLAAGVLFVEVTKYTYIVETFVSCPTS